MGPVREIGEEFLIVLSLDDHDVVLGIIFHRCNARAGMGRVGLFSVMRDMLISLLFVDRTGSFSPSTLGELEFARLGEGKACIKSSKCGNKRKADEDTPDFVGVLDIACFHVRLESRKGDDTD